LLAGLADEDVYMRIGAVRTTISPEAKEAGIEASDMASILIPVLENDDQTTDCWSAMSPGAIAALALGDLASEERELIPVIVPVLEQALLPLTCKSFNAESSLYSLGPEAIEAVPTLIKRLRLYLSMNVDEFYAQGVADTLTEITGQDFGTDANAWEEWWASQN
jgi:hypothetical protein